MECQQLSHPAAAAAPLLPLQGARELRGMAPQRHRARRPAARRTHCAQPDPRGTDTRRSGQLLSCSPADRVAEVGCVQPRVQVSQPAGHQQGGRIVSHQRYCRWLHANWKERPHMRSRVQAGGVALPGRHRCRLLCLPGLQHVGIEDAKVAHCRRQGSRAAGREHADAAAHGCLHTRSTPRLAALPLRRRQGGGQAGTQARKHGPGSSRRVSKQASSRTWPVVQLEPLGVAMNLLPRQAVAARRGDVGEAARERLEEYSAHPPVHPAASKPAACSLQACMNTQQRRAVAAAAALRLCNPPGLT